MMFNTANVNLLGYFFEIIYWKVHNVRFLILSFDSSAKLFKRATTGSSELLLKKEFIL